MRPLYLLGLASLCASLNGPAVALSGKLKEVESPGAARHHDKTYRSDTIEVSLKAAGEPGHKIESMVRMKSGDLLVYSWEAPPGTEIWHEFHGHSTGTVTFYKKAAGPAHHGALTAPFDGVHGWYYENRTKAPVTVRLKLSGYYEIVPKDAK